MPDVMRRLLPMPRHVSIGDGEFLEQDPANRVYLVDGSLPREGYVIEISNDGIAISSSDEDGRFWALQTLKQLDKGRGRFPFCRIEDWPEFHYRGVLVDGARCYYSIDGLKRIIDQMCKVKLNVFHWHFIENGFYGPLKENGWRIQVPGYPELTAKTENYYTRSDLEEIIEFAAKRHIRVIPEIEMPGHNDAAIFYPELSHQERGGGICVANEKTLAFFKDLIDYTTSVFPDSMVHFGGDEVNYRTWKDCSDCQAKIKDLGLETEAELQAWFMGEMAKHLKDKGRVALGWSDMLLQLTRNMHLNPEGFYTGYSVQENLPKEIVLTGWYGDWESPGGSAAIAANLGYKAIQYPFNHCYFDYLQGIPGDTHKYNVGYGDAKVTLQDAYMWDPYAGVKSDCRHNIIGVGCGNWGEAATDQEALEWKMWPRGFATAEVAWTCHAHSSGSPTNEEFVNFTQRAQYQGEQYRSKGISVAY